MTAISNFKKAAQMMRRRQKQHRINKMLLTCGINSVSIYRSHMETKAKLYQENVARLYNEPVIYNLVTKATWYQHNVDRL